MNHRLAAAFTLAAALAALGVAYFAQFGLHLIPCPLCLLERWPYRIAALLGFCAIFPRYPAARVLLALAALVLLADSGIAFIHVGVEQHWWNSPLPECNGVLAPGQPLPLVPAIPCDRPVYLIPHLPVSMALMDLCASLVFALALLTYVTRRRGKFR